MVAEDEAFEVAGEHEERLEGTEVNRYSLSLRRSSSVGVGSWGGVLPGEAADAEAIVIICP